MTDTPPSTSADETRSRLGPIGVVSLASLVGLHGLVRVAERTLAAFALESGAGPLVVGAAGTLALAVAVLARSIDRSDVPPRATATAATLLVALGLLCWVGAPSLDAALGVPLTVAGWLLVGAAFLGPWHARGPGAWLSVGDGGATITFGGAAHSSDGDERSAGRPGGWGADRRTRRVAGAVGLAAGAGFATAAFSGTATITAGFSVLAAAGAGAALVAAIVLAVGDADPLEAPGNPLPADAWPSSLADWRTSLEALPPAVRSTLLGDALVRIAVVSTSLYLVLVVVDVHAVGFAIGGVRLAPIAVFGLFLAAEAAGCVIGALAAPHLVDAFDRRWLLVGGLVIASLVPLALVAAPSNPLLLAALFFLFGCRTLVTPLRPAAGSPADPTLVATATDGDLATSDRSEQVRPAALESARAATRLALVPAPLVGGALYAIDPVLAFALATTAGVLGVRELLGPLATSAGDGT